MPAIDLQTWSRRAIYDYFLGYDDPWFNLTAEVEAGPTWRWCKEHDVPFSLACWWAVLRVVDEVPALRMRLRDDGVWLHDKVRLGVTALKPDHAFTYVYLEDAADFEQFVAAARAEIALRLASPGLNPERGRDDLIHGTVVPWTRFTSIKHARVGLNDGSVPKVAFGRATEVGDSRRLPVSVEAHHSLVDGLHAGQFFTALEAALIEPERSFTRS